MQSLQVKEELLNENENFSSTEAEFIMETEEEIITYCNKFLEEKLEWMQLNYDKLHSIVETENVQLQQQFIQILINDNTNLKVYYILY